MGCSDVYWLLLLLLLLLLTVVSIVAHALDEARHDFAVTPKARRAPGRARLPIHSQSRVRTAPTPALST